MLMKRAIFLIHGFNENIDKTFKSFLANTDFKGYDIIKHTVLGHDKESNFAYNEELELLDAKFSKVVSSYKEIYIIGFSMGGVLATHLAYNYRVTKLILIAPAFKYLINSNFFTVAQSILKECIHNAKSIPDARRVMDEYLHNHYESKDLIFREHKLEHADEVDALLNFILLVRHIIEEVNEIHVPTLILHGEKDELIPIESSLHIYNKITTDDKHLLILPNCYHRVLNDNNGRRYHKLIQDYIKYDVVRIEKR